ncbi:hypothetical protein [Methylocystis echinoides]|uniref:hypothetical protein n=1 Tax=Methylocystis echinoides TaxID=29468 RepID=UPI00341B7BD5
MDRLVVSVVNGTGERLFSAEFPSYKAAKSFVEWRIEELLASGAKYIDMVDRHTHDETRYCAAAIADGVFAVIETGWRFALVKRAA